MLNLRPYEARREARTVAHTLLDDQVTLFSHRIGTASERSPFALHRVAGSLVRAVREHPWTVEGPGRADSLAVEQLGVFAKYGAEGVMTMVAPNGATVALKVLDGSTRVGTLIAASLLARAGALPAADVSALLDALPLTVHGGGGPVGRIHLSPTL